MRVPRVIGSGCLVALAGRVGAEVAVFEAVAVAFEADQFGVVNEPVDHRDGDGLIAEDLPPGGERLVGRDDQALAFVAARDEHDAEAGFDVAATVRRRRGRPPIGSAAAQVESVRLDPELLEALVNRAHDDGESTSAVIRKALRQYLKA